MMNRRNALKNLGLTVGGIIATPTVLNILSSCTTETPWIPKFFTQEEGYLITSLVDIILPKSEDSPSATDVNVPQFIDKYILEVLEPEQTALLKKGLDLLSSEVLKVSEEQSLKESSLEQIESIVAPHLKVSKEKYMQNKMAFWKYLGETKQGKETQLDDNLMLFTFLDRVRELTIFGYKNSEFVGEKVLAYAPVPGQQKGCIDVNEASKGKAWSL